MHYLYRHIRLDRDTPFYVGVGTVTESLQYSPSPTERYKRAYSRTSRNSHWKNIVNITDYEVEILIESDNLEFIKDREREFIALYGREDLNHGCLCNFTDGGEGTWGRRNSEEVKLKMSLAAKERIERMGNKDQLVERLRKAPRNPKYKRICQYTLDGSFIAEYSSLSEAGKVLKLDIPHISQAANGRRRKCGGFIWKYKE